MTYKMGRRIEALIFEKGFSSIGKFAQYLQEYDPEHSVSEDTIRNIVKGKGAQNERLMCLAKGLGIPLECLIAENLPMVDGYLENEVREAMKDKKSPKEKRAINNLEIVKKLYNLDRRFYTSDEDDLYAECGYNITTLAEMTIYFPLCKLSDVMEVMSRVSGQVESYENYILNKYKWLYKTIPDSPAKRFADFEVFKSRLKSKSELDFADQKLLEELEEYEKSEELGRGYAQYRKILDKEYALFRNEIVQHILRAEVPEVYDTDSIDQRYNILYNNKYK